MWASRSTEGSDPSLSVNTGAARVRRSLLSDRTGRGGDSLPVSVRSDPLSRSMKRGNQLIQSPSKSARLTWSLQPGGSRNSNRSSFVLPHLARAPRVPLVPVARERSSPGSVGSAAPRMTSASANPRDAMYDRAQLLRRGSCWCTSRPPHVAGFTYVRAVGRALPPPTGARPISAGRLRCRPSVVAPRRTRGLAPVSRAAVVPVLPTGCGRGGQRERAALGVPAHGPPIAGVDDRAAELADALECRGQVGDGEVGQ